MKFFKTIFFITGFLFFFASCSSSSVDSSAASSTPTINISENSILSSNNGNLRLQASGSIEKINDASIDFYLGEVKQGSSSFSTATSDNNSIIITFSNLPKIESDASIVLSQGAFIIEDQQSSEQTIFFKIDTKGPTVSSTPSTAAGTFSATITFHENFSKIASEDIISSDFSYTGFSTTPDSLSISGREIVFSNLRFFDATASISLAAGIIEDELGNTNNAITLNFTNNATPISVITLTSTTTISSSQNTLTFTSSENIDSFNSHLISSSGISGLSLSASSSASDFTVTFPDLPDNTEDSFSISFDKGAIYSSGQPSAETSFTIRLDTLDPQVANYSPIESNRSFFNLSVTFSEQVYNNSNSAIDENNFTLSGFADNSIVPTITISNGRTVARFTGISFLVNTASATIEVGNIKDEAGNLMDNTIFFISNLLGPAVISGNCSVIPFDGGSGVTDDPYQISNLCQLQNVANNLSADYELTAEIDASWTRGWDNGAGFSPIGTESNPFRGNFNGNDYSVVALFISLPSISNVGFFGRTISASISNARLTRVDIQGNNNTGGLVGYNTNSSVIQNSSSAGSVSGVGNNIGGLVGTNTSTSTLQNSFATGSVSGNNNVGGLVGLNINSSIIQNSSSAGTAQGNQYVGGLAGINSNGSTIQNSFSAGSSQGNSNVGGLVGINNIISTIQNSFSAGSSQGNSNVGGLVGVAFSGSTATNSYWNSETSGQNTSVGGDARTSSQFFSANALFPDSDGTWDFGDNLSYPILVQNSADATTQHLHQSAGMIRLADATGTGFWGNTNLQQEFTLAANAIPTAANATVFALDVNAEATNDSTRVDFWDCATNNDTGILLTTSSVNGTSVTLQYGAENTITAAFEKATTPAGSCEVVRSSSGSVQAGDVLHLEAVISKGSGTHQRSYTRSFRLTLE